MGLETIENRLEFGGT